MDGLPLASSPYTGTCEEGADAILTNPAWPLQTSWSLPTPCRLCMPRHRDPRSYRKPYPSQSESQLSKESVTTFWSLLVFGLLHPGIPTHMPCYPRSALGSLTLHLLFLIAMGKSHQLSSPGSKHLSVRLSGWAASMDGVV